MKTIEKNNNWSEEVRIGTVMLLIVVVSMLFAGKVSAATNFQASNEAKSFRLSNEAYHSSVSVNVGLYTTVNLHI